jgi:hypothetical protein
MKKSELSFAEGFSGIIPSGYKQGEHNAFDWDRAAEIIKTMLPTHPNLVAEAGLQGDWEYTGGVIFENGKPTNDPYTFLASHWAPPTLIISVDGDEILEEVCATASSKRFDCETKWDNKSLKILGVAL